MPATHDPPWARWEPPNRWRISYGTTTAAGTATTAAGTATTAAGTATLTNRPASGVSADVALATVWSAGGGKPFGTSHSSPSTASSSQSSMRVGVLGRASSLFAAASNSSFSRCIVAERARIFPMMASMLAMTDSGVSCFSRVAPTTAPSLLPAFDGAPRISFCHAASSASS